jgi:hypothetical protein
MQFFIALSCLISVSVNFSTFLVIGKTSPVTYQVLGHLKTCLVLTFGYVLLHDPFSWRNIMGIFIALIGMISYSYYCTIQTQQKPSEASSQLSQVHESFFHSFNVNTQYTKIVNPPGPQWILYWPLAGIEVASKIPKWLLLLFLLAYMRILGV